MPSQYQNSVERDEAAIRAHPGWQSYPFLSIQLRNLPLDVDTLQVWESLKRYGHIKRIVIFENRHGKKTQNAEVRYQ